jgi:hypothetical protein
MDIPNDPSYSGKMGRRKLYSVNLNLPLPDEAFIKRLDDTVRQGETRLDVIREGILREIKRREAASSADRPAAKRKPGGDR